MGVRSYFELIDNKILEPVSKGEKLMEEMKLAVNTLMKYQKNPRKLLGFENDVKIDAIYPFQESKQSKQKIQ